ncbi:MAG TPA: tripartite tricarboxylate transporter substrate binding protein [Pseudolabrys sp.]|nr:tripartite tricarboxylate transporter substrate binding protein [Pseudolabrys sp.]
MKTLPTYAFASLAVAAAMTASPAHAQNWPTKPVTVIVPFAAGGNTDVAARIFTDRLSQRLGQPFIVENKSGAGGSIGISAMAKAQPDGYTMGIVTAGTLFILPHIYKDKLGYDGRKDIRPVAMVGTQPNLLIVHPSVPAKTVPEFIAYIKANPDKLSYGSSGIGTSQHLCMELIVQHTGAKIAHVPYRASNQIIQDLLGGQIQMTCDQFSTAYPQVQAGNAKAIAVSSLDRYGFDNSIPTLAESIPGLEVTWSAVFITPANVPENIRKKLADELIAITKEPAIIERLKMLSVTPASLSGADLEKNILADYDKWQPIVERAKIPQP